jgi:hypothetical protein
VNSLHLDDQELELVLQGLRGKIESLDVKIGKSGFHDTRKLAEKRDAAKALYARLSPRAGS